MTLTRIETHLNLKTASGTPRTSSTMAQNGEKQTKQLGLGHGFDSPVVSKRVAFGFWDAGYNIRCV